MNPDQIIARTAAAFRLTARDIIGPSRHRPIVRARQAAAWVLRYSPLRLDSAGDPVLRSLPRIARLLGRSDHSSICYHLGQAEQLRQRDPEWRALLDRLLVGEPAQAPFRFEPPPPLPPARRIRQRNDFSGGDAQSATRDSDALARQNGSLALAAALADYHAERAA